MVGAEVKDESYTCDKDTCLKSLIKHKVTHPLVVQLRLTSIAYIHVQWFNISLMLNMKYKISLASIYTQNSLLDSVVIEY